jgi:hypothetical protein
MNDIVSKNHLTAEKLVDYFSQILPEEEETAIELHLANCTECTTQARQIYKLSLTWDRWTARAHGEAHLSGLVKKALIHIREQPQPVPEHVPDLRQRLTDWLDTWAGKVEGSVRVIIEKMAEAYSLSNSRIESEGLEAILRPGGAWQFATAPSQGRGIQTRGTDTQLRVKIVETASALKARVSLDEDHGAIVVSVDDFPNGQTPPLVLLVPTGEGLEPRVKMLERDPETGRLPETSDLIARFEGVDPGQYLVAFEPLSFKQEQ